MYVQHRRIRLEAGILTSRKASVVGEVKQPPTPDSFMPISLVIAPLENVHHKPEGNYEGRINLGFEENNL